MSNIEFLTSENSNDASEKYDLIDFHAAPSIKYQPITKPSRGEFLYASNVNKNFRKSKIEQNSIVDFKKCTGNLRAWIYNLNFIIISNFLTFSILVYMLFFTSFMESLTKRMKYYTTYFLVSSIIHGLYTLLCQILYLYQNIRYFAVIRITNSIIYYSNLCFYMYLMYNLMLLIQNYN